MFDAEQLFDSPKNLNKQKTQELWNEHCKKGSFKSVKQSGNDRKPNKEMSLDPDSILGDKDSITDV